MDVRQLEYLVAVAEEGSFTRAAARVYAAQSTVSAGIRALEGELGAELFERDTRRVATTAAGQAALPIARRLLEDLAELRTAVADDGALHGTVQVGILTNVLVGDLLPDILGRFRADHPAVELLLAPSPTGSSGLVNALVDGRVDVAFLGMAPGPLVGLRSATLARSRLVVVLPSGHRLAGDPVDRPVAVAELADDEFVDSPVGFGNRAVVDRALGALGQGRRVTTEVADIAQLSLFVAAGLGVAVVPQHLVRTSPGVVVRPIDSDAEWELRVATRRHPSSAAAALFAAIVDGVRADGGGLSE